MLCVDDVCVMYVWEVLWSDVGDYVCVGMIDVGVCEVMIVMMDDDEIVLKFGDDVCGCGRLEIDLLFATSRFKVLRRLWASFALLGFGCVVLVNV